MYRKPPPRRPLKSAEDRLQECCVTWARHQLPELLLIHIHQNPRSKAQGAKLKAMGLKRGVPDLQAILPDGQSIWIELKTETGRLSPDQRRFHESLRERGHEIHTARSLDDFRQIFATAGLWIPRITGAAR